MLDGPFYQWYPKGKLKSVEENCRDLPCGYRMEWDSTGNLSSIEVIDTMIVATDNIDGLLFLQQFPFMMSLNFIKMERYIMF